MFTDEGGYDILAVLTRFEEVERARISPSPSDFRQTYSYGKRRCVHCTEMDLQECAIPRTLHGNTRSCNECTAIGIECSYNPNNKLSGLKYEPNSPVNDLEEENKLYDSTREFLIALMSWLSLMFTANWALRRAKVHSRTHQPQRRAEIFIR